MLGLGQKASIFIGLSQYRCDLMPIQTTYIAAFLLQLEKFVKGDFEVNLRIYIYVGHGITPSNVLIWIEN